MRKTILAILLALPMTIFAQKIGHVNTAIVVEGMSEYTALKAEVETLKKQFSDEIQRKQTAKPRLMPMRKKRPISQRHSVPTASKNSRKPTKSISSSFRQATANSRRSIRPRWLPSRRR